MEPLQEVGDFVAVMAAASMVDQVDGEELLLVVMEHVEVAAGHHCDYSYSYYSLGEPVGVVHNLVAKQDVNSEFQMEILLEVLVSSDAGMVDIDHRIVGSHC